MLSGQLEQLEQVLVVTEDLVAVVVLGVVLTTPISLAQELSLQNLAHQTKQTP